MNSFEEYLQNCLNNIKDSKVKEAMLYSLLAGGKRISPAAVVFSFKSLWYRRGKRFSMCGGNEMIEYLFAYS